MCVSCPVPLLKKASPFDYRYSRCRIHDPTFCPGPPLAPLLNYTFYFAVYHILLMDQSNRNGESPPRNTLSQVDKDKIGERRVESQQDNKTASAS